MENILIARVGQYTINNEIKYKLEFKEGKYLKYYGISLETFDTKIEANKVLKNFNENKIKFFIFARNKIDKKRFLCKILK